MLEDWQGSTSSARGIHRGSFYLGTTRALDFWDTWASGTTGPVSASLAIIRAESSVIQD